MEDLLGAVRQAERTLSATALADDDLLTMLAAAARVIRFAEAVLADGVGEVRQRSAQPERADRVTTTFGCGDVNELMRRTTRASRQRVAEWERAGRSIHRHRSLSSGELLPTEYPALRDALCDGEVGAEAVTMIARALDRAHGATRDGRLAADTELAASARGDRTSPATSADDLRMQAEVWVTFLDQDGKAPDAAEDTLPMRRRDVHVGRVRNGVVPIRGSCSPKSPHSSNCCATASSTRTA
jgi:hypothetical protein